MKIVQVIGGLGNQMFQYALAVVLGETFHDEVKLDIHPFRHYTYGYDYQLERVFDVNPTLATASEVRQLYYPLIGCWFYYRVYKNFFPLRRNEFREAVAVEFDPEVLRREGDGYYDGYWQDYRYFSGHEELIRNTFRYRQPLEGRNADAAAMFDEGNYASLHVRKGDYDADRTFGGLCGVDYYRKAIERVRLEMGDDVRFALFSNDMAWCRENILPLVGVDRAVAVDWNRGDDSYLDMRLMSHCRANILANSSFSWWGAYLNVHSDPVAIAPRLWVRGAECRRQLPSWLIIDNEDERNKHRT